ncbi:Zn(2)-C6 fungal-type domain-containing protein [Fusarium falciforme]|uniref:Zn(2)-C6 fungal-type domain-containing protein n=1 Tax=Fusarium falciforme TaxID=195108 RepID=UPI002301E855|nr:Zn(2)-C6 fungal-type domain-containing protein [Fusarium falciforme]WAO95520.1 Zn(2)-C6 fungal-type domain-containing protein [Fusarium falciforme]
MPPRSQPRAMTFTGCWTCKRRKVRCDLRPTACRNCEKRGIVCEGYGIRLQWVSDSLGQAESRTGLQGRRSLRLDQTCNLYESATIDNFLSAVDHETEHNAVVAIRLRPPILLLRVEARQLTK